MLEMPKKLVKAEPYSSLPPFPASPSGILPHIWSTWSVFHIKMTTGMSSAGSSLLVPTLGGASYSYAPGATPGIYSLPRPLSVHLSPAGGPLAARTMPAMVASGQTSALGALPAQPSIIPGGLNAGHSLLVASSVHPSAMRPLQTALPHSPALSPSTATPATATVTLPTTPTPSAVTVTPPASAVPAQTASSPMPVTPISTLLPVPATPSFNSNTIVL